MPAEGGASSALGFSTWGLGAIRVVIPNPFVQNIKLFQRFPRLLH
jgi:hypothetical protein